MALNGENGNGMIMPVAPMYGGYGGYGMDGFGGGNGWWIVLLLLAFAGRGFGFGGGNGYGDGTLPYLLNTNTQNDVNRGFDNAGLSNQISGLTTNNQLGNIQTSINTGFANAEVANCNRAFNQMQTAYQNQISSMQNQFNLATAVDDRLDNLSMALQKCCCDNELAIAGVNNNITAQAAENRYQNALNTRDILTNNTANTQAILDKLCQLELDGVRAERDNLRSQLTAAQLAASQAAQTGQLIADNAQQTANLIQRIAPYYNNGYNGCSCGCGFNQGVA